MAEKKPSYKAFENAAAENHGNISKIATAFGVYRGAVHRWINGDPKFKEVLEHYRGQLLDDCVSVGRIVALGIPERDKDGKLSGWKAPPDPSMLRYFMSTLGRKEGYGEDPPEKDNTDALQAIEPPMIIFEK